MPDPLDLSGSWDGVFSYPGNHGPTTPFVAEVTDKAGAFDGSIIEPNLYESNSVEARIVGHRSGHAVDFVKTYLTRSEGYENPVDYVGQISEDGLIITGVWSLMDWNGEFEMTRDAGIEAGQEQTASVEA